MTKHEKKLALLSLWSRGIRAMIDIKIRYRHHSFLEQHFCRALFVSIRSKELAIISSNTGKSKGEVRRINIDSLLESGGLQEIANKAMSEVSNAS